MARRNLRTQLQEVLDALRDEASYALADIRQTHERLWFGQAQTPALWQQRAGESRDLQRQQARFHELYGMAEPKAEQSLQSDQSQSVLNGIGKTGDDRSNWEAVKQAAQAYYGDKRQFGLAHHPDGEKALERYEIDIADLYGKDIGHSASRQDLFGSGDIHAEGSHLDFQQAHFEELYGERELNDHDAARDHTREQDIDF